MLCNRGSLVLIGLLTLLIAAGCARVRPCLTEIAPPSGTEPEELVRLATDSTGDFILDHPLFTEVYDVEFEDNASIPPALDIVQVEVLSDGGIHTIRIRTREGDVGWEIRQENQRVSFGVHIDSDGNGVSDYLLTTTDNPERGVIVTPEFEFVAEMPGLVLEDNAVTMQIPEEIAGAHFDWLVFSGYSPKAEAFHTTSLDGVFFVPQVDIVRSVAGMAAIVSFYAGPGTCQLFDQRAISRCPASGPLTTVPGTSLQGKMFYRKQCGTTMAEFWCVGGAFGTRVYGGGTTGWVGRCPYPYGMNFMEAYDSNNDQILDKVFHSIRDAVAWDPSDPSAPYDPMKHNDSDTDHRIDLMEHTYLFASNQVESCNVERNESTGAQILPLRCCPKRKPYANQGDVPGPGIDPTSANPTSPYDCRVSAP